MYRDFDDMNAKLERLLSHDRERVELIDYFKSKVRAEHTFVGLVAEAVAWVRETRA
jgi:spore maturation protein CgeB